MLQLFDLEIYCCRLLRQSYLQHGGGDIAILMHLADLEKEASAAEQKSKASPAQHHSGSDHWPIQNSKIAAICFKAVTGAMVV